MQSSSEPDATCALSGREQWNLLRWMMAHPGALLEDTLPQPGARRRLNPNAGRLTPIAWLCLHVLAGVLVALALARRSQ